MKSLPSVVTPACGKWNAIPRQPTRPAWRAMRWLGLEQQHQVANSTSQLANSEVKPLRSLRPMYVRKSSARNNLRWQTHLYAHIDAKGLSGAVANRPKLQAHKESPRHFGGEGLTLSNLVVAQYPTFQLSWKLSAAAVPAPAPRAPPCSRRGGRVARLRWRHLWSVEPQRATTGLARIPDSDNLPRINATLPLSFGTLGLLSGSCPAVRVPVLGGLDMTGASLGRDHPTSGRGPGD